MKYSLFFAVFAVLLFTACESPTPEPCENPPCNEEESLDETDSITTSFVFVGCNRLQWNDTDTSITHSDASTANFSALKNIFKRVAQSPNKPDYFFFLGDIVNGEATNEKLDLELKTWTQDYNSGAFTDFKSSGITMIPVPGNHEMLDQHEKPLAGTTATWLKYMGKYMPANRDSITGSANDFNNKMTYGFTDGNIAFIVINTDTYNTNDERTRFSYEWVKQQVQKYRSDQSIDHIFVMGHRPFYVSCQRETSGKSGIAYPEDSDPVWQSFENNEVASMLSAHMHEYQRMQPNKKTYQLIAGNGGSELNSGATFFGYTRVNVYASGRIEMISEGYTAGSPYYERVEKPQWSVKDSLFDMNWYRKGAPVGGDCKCVNGEKSHNSH